MSTSSLQKNELPLISFERAVELMKAARPVIFPTETLFGLGSRALDADASARVFRAKHRSTVRPLPLILGNWEQLEQVAKVPSFMMPLLQVFWPGPLSVLFPARLRVPEVLTGGTGRVAVRLSSHPVAAALARAVGEPITASSANISGRPAAKLASELDPELFAEIGGVLDMPPLPGGGLPSTLIEVDDRHELIVRRDGAISREQLLEAGFPLAAEGHVTRQG
ncbi:MAG TPA: threonylcarbamoyl-AMP synthase [Candidatus Avidesulfovibrio excrementigallinarum]|nr:threonylcarbamoyl-AMP synthase [Candidatus Avidesulfovibrio excrementigallinarum]